MKLKKLAALLLAAGLTVSSVLTPDSSPLGGILAVKASAEENESSDTRTVIGGLLNDRLSFNLPSAQNGEIIAEDYNGYYSSRFNAYCPQESYYTNWRENETWEERYERYNSYPIRSIETRWYDEENPSVIATGEFFKDHIYRAEVTVTAKDNYRFTDEIKSKVRAVTNRGFLVPATNMTVSDDGNTLTIVYYSKAAQGYYVGTDTEVSDKDNTGKSIYYTEIADEIYVDGEKLSEHKSPIVDNDWSDFGRDGLTVTDFTVTGFSDDEEKTFKAGNSYEVTLIAKYTGNDSIDLTNVKFITDVNLNEFDRDFYYSHYTNNFIGSQNVTSEAIDSSTVKFTYTVTATEKTAINENLTYEFRFAKLIGKQYRNDTIRNSFSVYSNNDNGKEYYYGKYCYNGPWERNLTDSYFTLTNYIVFKKNYIISVSDSDIKIVDSIYAKDMTDISYTVNKTEKYVNGYEIVVTSAYGQPYELNGATINIRNYYYSLNYRQDLFTIGVGMVDTNTGLGYGMGFDLYVSESNVISTSPDYDISENAIHDRELNVSFKITDERFVFTPDASFVNPQKTIGYDSHKYLKNLSFNASTKEISFNYTPWFAYYAYDSATADITVNKPTYRDDQRDPDQPGGGWVTPDPDTGDDDDNNDKPNTPSVPGTRPVTPTVTPSAPASTNTSTNTSTGTSTDKDNVLKLPDSTNGTKAAEEITDFINKTESKDKTATVILDKSEDSMLDREIIEAAAGKDVDIEIPMKSADGTEYKWTINGNDIDKDCDVGSIDMNVDFGISNIPMSERIRRDALDYYPGRYYSDSKNTAIQFTLSHNGDFGFKASLEFKMKPSDAGKHVYIYYYNKEKNTIELSYTAQVAKDGTVRLEFTHASEYIMFVTDDVVDAAQSVSLTISIDKQTTSSVSIEWEKKSNASGYVVEMLKNGKWERLALIKGADNTSYTVERLSPATEYTLRIRSFTMKNGKRYLKKTGDEIVISTAPGKVQEFKASKRTSNSIKLSWKKDKKADGYVLQTVENGKWVTVKTYNSNSYIGRTVKGLKSGKEYKFRICSFVNSEGGKTYGNYITIKVSTK